MKLWERAFRVKNMPVGCLQTQLRRCLTTFDITLLGVGHMIGAGIYVLTGSVVRNIAGPSIVLSFLLAGVAALLSALCYAEFGARFPKAGSAYTYAYVGVGELWAFIIGWNIILEHMLGSAAVARSWSGYLDSLLGNVISNTTIAQVGNLHSASSLFGDYPDMVAFLVAIAVAIFIGLGSKASTNFNNIFTIINIVVITIVVTYGLTFADFTLWEGTNDQGISKFFPFGVEGMLAGAASCFFAFIGFDGLATAGEEAISPSRSIPIATFISMSVVTAAYILMAMALTLMIPYTSVHPTAAFSDAFAMRDAPLAKYLVSGGALAGMMTSLKSVAVSTNVAGSPHFLPIIPRVEREARLKNWYPPTSWQSHRGSRVTSWSHRVTSWSHRVTPCHIAVTSWQPTNIVADLREAVTAGDKSKPPALGQIVTLVDTATRVGGMFALPRCVYAMAEDGLLFRQLALVNPTTQVPVYAVIVFGSMTAIIALLFDITTLVEFLSIGTLLAYSIVSACVIILRYQPALLPEDNSPDHGGRLRELMPGRQWLMQKLEPGRSVHYAVFTMITGFLIFGFLVRHGEPLSSAAHGIAFIFSLFLSVGSFVFIQLHHQNTQELDFKVPFVPLIPSLSLLFNVLMMTNLSPLTWVRLAVWMAIGMAIYLGYGMWNSTEEQEKGRRMSKSTTYDSVVTQSQLEISQASVDN